MVTCAISARSHSRSRPGTSGNPAQMGEPTMTRLISFVVVLSSVLLGQPIGAFAQSPPPQPADRDLVQDLGKQVRFGEVVLKGGSRIFGTIVSEDEEQVVLKNESGTVVTARRSDIASLR